MKKAMVFSTIVKAALVLVVLFILLSILWTKLGWFNQNTTTCQSRGGTCSNQGKCSEGTVLMFTTGCESYNDDGSKKKGLGQCCIPI